MLLIQDDAKNKIITYGKQRKSGLIYNPIEIDKAPKGN